MRRSARDTAGAGPWPFSPHGVNGATSSVSAQASPGWSRPLSECEHLNAMSSSLKFDREFAHYGDTLSAAERDPAVSNVLMQILGEWAYPVSALMGAKLARADLYAEDRPTGAMELLFQLSGHDFVEIVTHLGPGQASYAGWLVAGVSVELLDEELGDYAALLVTRSDGARILHQFIPGFGYEPVPGHDAVPLRASRRVRLRRGI